MLLLRWDYYREFVKACYVTILAVKKQEVQACAYFSALPLPQGESTFWGNYSDEQTN